MKADEAVPYDRNLTFDVPEGWWPLVSKGIGKCQQPKFAKYWEKGWTDRLWDLDNLGPDREQADEFAANLCGGCPIMEQCLEAALMEEGKLSARMRSQIRGGTTPAKRAEIALNIERKPLGPPLRDIPLHTCGVDECVLFDHPNGSWRCRLAANQYSRERKRALRRAEKAA